MTFAAVGFDLDDTLMDRRGTLLRYLEKVKSDLFPEQEGAKIISAFDKAAKAQNSHRRDFLGKVLKILNRPSGELEVLENHWVENFFACAVLNPGAVDCLETLKKHYPLFLLTNGDSVSQRRKIAQIKIAHYFNQILVSGDTDFQKPDIRVFGFVNYQPSKKNPLVYIGDNPLNDIHAGKKAGFHTIWFNPNRKDYPDNLLSPDYTVLELNQIYSILNRKNL